MKNHKYYITQASGFTMIEVLVAMLVLSVGLLGFASLQINALKNNQNSYLRTEAVLLANDFADRLRSNPVGIAANNYNNITAAAGTANDCSLVTCNANDISNFDTVRWYAELDRRLPSGTGAVTGNGSGSAFTVTVMWDDARTGAIGTNCDPANSNDLMCYSINLIP